VDSLGQIAAMISLRRKQKIVGEVILNLKNKIIGSGTINLLARLMQLLDGEA